MTNERITEHFTANYIGRCPVKGCDCTLHIAIPMTRTRWQQPRRDAYGNTWNEWKSDTFPQFLLRGWHPYQLEIHCVKHRRAFGWKAVNGRLSESHVCNDGPEWQRGRCRCRKHYKRTKGKQA